MNYQNYYGTPLYYVPAEMHDRETKKFFGIEDAFRLGNISIESYSKYRHYEPRQLVASSPLEQLELDIQKCGFMCHDLGLYLDIYPNDKNALNLYSTHKTQYNELVKEYEMRGGVITKNVLNNQYNWLGSWPWGGKK